MIYLSHRVVFVLSMKIPWHYIQKAISLHSEWWEKGQLWGCIHFLILYFHVFQDLSVRNLKLYVTHNLNAAALSLQHIATQKFFLFLWILLIKSVLLRDKCCSATPYLIPECAFWPKCYRLHNDKVLSLQNFFKELLGQVLCLWLMNKSSQFFL